MLILTRRAGQSLVIEPQASLDPTTLASELFNQGPIEIVVNRIEARQVRIGINAHTNLLVVRDELVSEIMQGARHPRGLRRK